MKVFLGLLALTLVVPVFLVGCGNDAPPAKPDRPAAKAPESAQDPADPEVREALSKLNPEDQERARQQEFCAVMADSRLGSMGVPVKVEIKGQPVFLCCKGCQRRALASPEKTLAEVERLKDRNKVGAGGH